MNEQLQQKLLEYLQNGESFVREQAPEFVNQAMAYYAWDLKFGLLACLGVTTALLLLWFVCLCAEESYDSLAAGVGQLVIPMLIVFFGMGAYCHYTNLMKLEIAPKLFLLDKLTNHGGK